MDVDNTEEFRCISLCSGYAGLELGLRRVIPNLRTVAYVEREGFACANLVAKIEAGKLDAAPIWTDVKTFPEQLFHKRVHIITAGYPCQPFSVAGKRQGTDDPRHLWPHIERIIQTVEPIWFFGENVSGHLAIGFPTVYRSLRLMGYKVEAGLFTAEEVGAPHKRERLFILGYSEKQRFNRGKPEQDKWGFPGICSVTGTGTTRWPSRPGQPQYEWEEPRTTTLVKSPYRITPSRGNELSSQQKATTDRQTIRIGFTNKNNRWQEIEEATQSRLGRTTYGTQSRVDRLRLLGNGVVPQQAELAFRTLIKLFPVETKI